MLETEKRMINYIFILCVCFSLLRRWAEAHYFALMVKGSWGEAVGQRIFASAAFKTKIVSPPLVAKNWTIIYLGDNLWQD